MTGRCAAASDATDRLVALQRHTCSAVVAPDLFVALILSDMQGRSDPWLPSTPRSFVKLARLYGFFKLGMVFECGFWLLHTN